MALTLDQIRAAQNRTPQTLSVKALGGDVLVLGLGAGEAGDYSVSNLEHGPDGLRPKLSAVSRYQVQLVALTLCDGDGVLLVPRVDGKRDTVRLREIEAVIAELGGDVVDEIYNFAATLSGIGTNKESGELPNAPTANSSSD